MCRWLNFSANVVTLLDSANDADHRWFTGDEMQQYNGVPGGLVGEEGLAFTFAS